VRACKKIENKENYSKNQSLRDKYPWEQMSACAVIAGNTNDNKNNKKVSNKNIYP